MKHLAFTFIIFSCFETFAQIPNAGFEEWSNVNGQLIPDDWEVECCMGYVTRDTAHVQGDYSIRLFGDLYGIDAPEPTVIRTKIYYSTPPDKLRFFCKCILEDAPTTGYCGLQVYTIQNGGLGLNWFAEEAINEFEEVTIDFDSLHLQQDGKFNLYFFASETWGWPPPFGTATMFIDSVSLVYTTSFSTPGLDFITISPNPFNQFIRVNGSTDLSVERLILRDMVGRIICETHTDLLATNDLLAGQYYLTVIDEKRGSVTRLVIKSP